MNSVLFDEAGCHTPTGTAAVILGRVSQVRFANNIIFGVPSTDSPDETGIDFEWSEDHVDLQSNLFAGNAGPGVEILNIHSGDHSSDLDFDGNTFAQNAYSHKPGAASVWEDNKGRGFGTPAGKVRNNLYFEPYGKFLGGKNIGSVADANNLPTTMAANYAAEQFSACAGKEPVALHVRGVRFDLDGDAELLRKRQQWSVGDKRDTIRECIQHGAGNVCG